MNETNTFSRVSRNDNGLYGPRALLVCGFTAEGQNALANMVQATGIDAWALIFATTKDLETNLGVLFQQASGTGHHEPSRMPAALIIAGITEAELHNLMEGYRQAGMPWPLWATLTPTSENWTLRTLLKELAAERAALAARPAAKPGV